MSRHLLSCLHRVLGALAYLLIGALAVAFKPLIWSWGCARVSNIGQQSRLILLLDSFEPNELAQILAQATTHCSMIWVLLQDQQSVTAASDLTSHRSFQSRLVTLFPAKSMVLLPLYVGRSRVVTLRLLASLLTMANELSRCQSCCPTAATLMYTLV